MNMIKTAALVSMILTSFACLHRGSSSNVSGDVRGTVDQAIQNGCYNLTLPGAGQKGALCVYSTIAELGGPASETLIAYFSIDFNKLAFCNKAVSTSVLGQTTTFVTKSSDGKQSVITFDSSKKNVKLGSTVLTYKQALIHDGQLDQLAQEDLCKIALGQK